MLLRLGITSLLFIVTWPLQAQLKVYFSEEPHNIDLPLYTEECGTYWDVMLDRKDDEGMVVIDSLFETFGYKCERGHYIKNDSISVPLTGYIPSLDLGYVWIDWSTISHESIDFFFNISWLDGEQSGPLVPDLDSEYNEDILGLLACRFHWEFLEECYDESIVDLSKKAMNESDPELKQSLYTKALEAFILNGVFWELQCSEEQYPSFEMPLEADKRKAMLNNVLAYQRLVHLKAHYNWRGSMESLISSTLDTLQLQYAPAAFERLNQQYEDERISTSEVEILIEQASEFPTQLIFFQINHPENTMPNSYSDRYFNNNEKRRLDRLKSKPLNDRRDKPGLVLKSLRQFRKRKTSLLSLT